MTSGSALLALTGALVALLDTLRATILMDLRLNKGVEELLTKE